MILRILLFLSYGMLVSSNNGYPIIPPQTYPIYQQNGYANPSTNQPSDSTPYLQSLMVQNQSPPLDLSPFNLRQTLLNTILSSQSMKTIFDQNSQGYGLNLVETSNNAIAPNAVNNYFAAPMVNEYVNNHQQTGANKDDKVAGKKTEEKRKKPKKRKSSKSRRNHVISENNQNSASKNVQDNDKDVTKKSSKRSRKSKSEAASQDSHTKNYENGNNKKTKKKKQNHKENDVKNLDAEENKVEEPKPRRRRKKKPKSDKENTEKVNLEQRTTPKPNQIQEGINLAHFNEGIVEENRVPRNPIPEGNDLFKSIPNLPQNLANRFNFKGMPQFNNPAMSNIFANYENIYQSMMANNKGTNDQREVIKRKPKRKNNTNTKIGAKNNNSTVTKATVQKSPPKPIVSPKINVVTTEKTIIIKEKTLTNIDPIPKDEGLKSSDNPSEEKKAVHEFENEEIKDMKMNINDPAAKYEQYIDDYYPQFTDSAAYPTANNREVYIKNLGDTKYYYAVDKGNPEFINRMRFEGFGLPERVTKDYDVSKKYDDAEEKGTKNAQKPNSKDIKEEVIQFRSPPQLEIPDFQTRKIEKSEICSQPFYDFDDNDDFDPRFLADKASVYSEAKGPYYAETKENIKKIEKEKHKDVETVYARSKVVNYGPVYNPKDDSTSAGTSNQDLTDDSYFKDGGTTYVLASSLDYPESFW